MSEHPVLARLCEAVGMQYANLVVVTDSPQPPAYLRPPTRKRKRAIIRAALGRECSARWYRFHVANRHDGPAVRRHMAEMEEYRRRTAELAAIVGNARAAVGEMGKAWSVAAFGALAAWEQVKRELGLLGGITDQPRE